MDLVGAQQIWVGKSDAGRTVTLWADLASVHVVLDDDVVKTTVSRLTTADLDRLAMRDSRPGRSAPALPAFDPAAPAAERVPVEADRTATRDGIVVLLGHQLALGPDTAGTRVTLQIDGGLIHAVAGSHLIKALPNPLVAADLGPGSPSVRQATAPLPPPPPAEPQRLHRRSAEDGVVMVAG
ncbi:MULTISPECIES: hypothetical protein [Rhodococcus]|uniref:hypothetical protein n=1 Tax=Rhodococcus TaxID=1827 RepID=UPI000686D1A8|nr:MULTISPECIES: hypothetical protein [Rhodococcus]QQZ18134.1 hypothetical protein GO592_19080 [Rhodococcus sp. 21391]